MLFVNVPIGLVVALAAPRVLGESDAAPRQASTCPAPSPAPLGLAALVYGLSNAATSENGVSHWGDTKVVASLVAAVVLLAAFAVIEARSQHALLPVAGAAQPGPVRRLPDHAVRGHRACSACSSS